MELINLDGIIKEKIIYIKRKKELKQEISYDEIFSILEDIERKNNKNLEIIENENKLYNENLNDLIDKLERNNIQTDTTKNISMDNKIIMVPKEITQSEKILKTLIGL